MPSDPDANATAPIHRALFASDMHLGEHEPQLTTLFCELLAQFCQGVSHLYLLGDLFEAWIGDDVIDPTARQLAATLAALSGGGVRITALRGNRDFLLGHRHGETQLHSYAAQSGMQLLEEPLLINLFGARTLLCHGDALCTDDVEYQEFRTTSRTATWRQAFLARSAAERRQIALQYRQLSETSKQGKAEMLMDVNADSVDLAMDRSGADHLIHGHTHRPAVHRWRHDGLARERWVLPDWSVAPQRGGFLRVDASGWQPLGHWPN